MPITYNNLFDNIISFENLYGAFQDTIAHAERSVQTRLRFVFALKSTSLIFMMRSHPAHGGHRHIIAFSVAQR